MRTIPFKEVLWSIAYKVGLNPAQEFLSDEGESLASYINAWVRRTWDAQDFPEWTTLKEFAPDANHQVPYQAIPVGASEAVVLSRPLKVYLVDPRATPYPIDTRFRVWEDGLHVGFDHGQSVWIKYIGPAPRFSSIPWDSGVTYDAGDVVYSPVTGECYVSRLYNNQGNDPSVLVGPINLVVDVVTPFVPGSAASPTIPEKWYVRVDTYNFYALAAQVYAIDFLDSAGAPHTLSYTTPAAGGTTNDVLDGLIAAAAASSDTWIQALTLLKNVAQTVLVVQSDTAPFSVSDATVTSPDVPITGDDGLGVTGDDGLAVTSER